MSSNNNRILINIFVVIIVIGSLIIYLVTREVGDFSAKHNLNQIQNTKETQNSQEQFPMSGKEVATMNIPIKAFLDPLKSTASVIGDGDAKFVWLSDNSKYYICDKKEGNKYNDGWWEMPVGNYLIYPYNCKKILFQWNIKNE